MKRRIQRQTWGRIGLTLTVAWGLVCSLSGCSWPSCDPDPIVNRTIATLQGGIDQLATSSSSWQIVLQDMEKQLVDSTQSTLRNEVSDLLQSSIGVANSSVLCDADFIGHRVKQSLQRMLDQVKGQPSQELLEPAACSGVPSSVDFQAWRQSRVPKVDIFGYDFDNPKELSLWLVTGNNRQEVTSRLSKVSNYQLAVVLGGKPELFSGEQQKLVLAWKNNLAEPVSTIPVALPVTPLCQTRKITIPQIPPIGFVPEHTGSGDAEFDGHGPQVWTQVSLDVIGGGSGLQASIYMRAKETQADWTEVQGTHKQRVFQAEPGWKVDHIITPARSSVDVYTHGKGVNDTRQPGGPVDHEDVTADTTGADVGKVGVAVTFSSVDVWEVQTGDCVTPDQAKELMRRSDLSPDVRSRLEGESRRVDPAFFARRR